MSSVHMHTEALAGCGVICIDGFQLQLGLRVTGYRLVKISDRSSECLVNLSGYSANYCFTGVLNSSIFSLI